MLVVHSWTYSPCRNLWSSGGGGRGGGGGGGGGGAGGGVGGGGSRRRRERGGDAHRRHPTGRKRGSRCTWAPTSIKCMAVKKG